MQYKASVVIPCFNAAEYIRETVKSALNQLDVDVEVVAVDDKSTDNTVSILEEMSAAFPGRLILIDGPGKGPAAARNAGIRAASTEHIAFLDADDVWLPDKLAKQFVRASQELEEGLVYSDRIWIDGEGEAIPHTLAQSYFPEGRVFSDMIVGNYVVTSSVLVSKAALVRVGGFSESEDFKNCQDYHLWLRLAEFLPFYAVKEPLIKYRVHANNRHKNLVPRYRGMISCLKYADSSDFWMSNEKAPHEQTIRKRLSEIHCSYAQTFFRKGDYASAWRASIAAVRSGAREWRIVSIAAMAWLPDPLLKRLAAFR